jgi:ketosteroid isomerase-like protein
MGHSAERRWAWSSAAAACVASLLVASASSGFAKARPTAESALAADEALAHAMQANDGDGITRWLDKDWAVIATTGGIGEGPQVFPSGIKSGYLIRKTFETSEPRVRVFGDTAVVTTKVRLSGVFNNKEFEVGERQTDVWVWRDGGWKCVLTHETKLPG